MIAANIYLFGFLFNFLVAFIIVRFVYYPINQSKKYVFTFIAFNTIIYFVFGLLNQTNLSVGAGFGLFAIFSILRYRTDAIPIREMTYLFIVVGLPVVNSILMGTGNWAEIVIADGAVITILYYLENEWGFHYELSKKLTYERIEMIKPENHHLLLQDLRQRTGLPIKRFEIGRIDFLRDVTEVKIFYDEADLLNININVDNLSGGVKTTTLAPQYANNSNHNHHNDQFESEL